MQVIASSVGGYLAGRLRTRWRNVHTHEVFFRDTAHGFLAWAVGLVITAAFLTSAATSIVGGAVQGAAGQAAESPNGYWVDRMLRANAPRAESGATEHTEIGSVLASSLKDGHLAPDDRSVRGQSHRCSHRIDGGRGAVACRRDLCSRAASGGCRARRWRTPCIGHFSRSWSVRSAPATQQPLAAGCVMAFRWFSSEGDERCAFHPAAAPRRSYTVHHPDWDVQSFLSA